MIELNQLIEEILCKSSQVGHLVWSGQTKIWQDDERLDETNTNQKYSTDRQLFPATEEKTKGPLRTRLDGKHMRILPVFYISEAANLLWLPQGVVSPVISIYYPAML